MKCWRVMGNNRKKGTWCVKDMLATESDAIDLRLASLKADPESSFFTQDYEEARTGKIDRNEVGNEKYQR